MRLRPKRMVLNGSALSKRESAEGATMPHPRLAAGLGSRLIRIDSPSLKSSPLITKFNTQRFNTMSGESWYVTLANASDQHISNSTGYLSLR